MSTHEVTNQSTPRVGVNEFTANTALREAVTAFAPAADVTQLHRIGELVGSAGYQRWADAANTHRPVLHQFDRYGHRIDEVEYDPSYHALMAASMEHGMHSGPWADPGPNAHAARAAGFYLFNQVEPGHCCPISMTYSAVPTLRHQPEVAAHWEPLVRGIGYDPVLRPADTKPGVVFGMAMTEKQGGSDVRANSTWAVPIGDGGPGEEYLLTGHKWFCSAPMSDAFLVLAQALPPGSTDRNEAKLSCFVMPRVLPDGTRNAIRLQRLKDKLGNWSNASAEIELAGAWAQLVGEPGAGVRTIIEMVSRTRLDCVIGTAGGMRQGLVEAIWHARRRAAFGATLVDQPGMTAVLADLALESEAATWTALRLAAAHEDEVSEDELAFRRIATPIAKYWVCKRGPGHAYEAMECLGGNGYIENFPLARRYREAPVLAIWEGSGTVIALDVLRALVRHPWAGKAFLAEVERAAGESRILDEHLARVHVMLDEVGAAVGAASGADGSAAGPEVAGRARGLAEAMALALQASLLVRYAPSEVAGAFLGARLGPDRSYQYGVLPAGTPVRSLVERATAASPEGVHRPEP